MNKIYKFGTSTQINLPGSSHLLILFLFTINYALLLLPEVN